MDRSVSFSKVTFTVSRSYNLIATFVCKLQADLYISEVSFFNV